MEILSYEDLIKSLEKLYRGYLASEIAEIDDRVERCQIYEDLSTIRNMIKQLENNTP